MSAIVISNEEAIGFCCNPIPNGWTYTLTTHFGQLIREAEDRYGERDYSWTPLGIEFGGDRPCLWYPGNVKNVSIKLSDNARKYPYLAYCQLAHETVHLLSPTGTRNSLLIEEGVATNFAYEMSRKKGPGFSETLNGYLYARTITQEFLSKHPDGILKLRRKTPSFCDFTPKLIRRIFPDISEKLATDLCETFSTVEARLNKPV